MYKDLTQILQKIPEAQQLARNSNFEYGYMYITLYNVCPVHRGMFSTLRAVQYIGGYHKYMGEYYEHIGGC